MSVHSNFLSPYVKFVGLQNLIQRNEQLYSSGNAPSGGVALPFILVQVDFFSLFPYLVPTLCVFFFCFLIIFSLVL